MLPHELGVEVIVRKNVYARMYLCIDDEKGL